MARIGPTFGAELRADGLGDGLAFPENGDSADIVGLDSLTAAQRATFDAVLAAHDPTKTPSVTFFARDLVAQLTPGDYTNITQAVVASPSIGLLWSSLLAQGEAPISTNSARFKQGWTALSQALGGARASAVAAALHIPATA